MAQIKTRWYSGKISTSSLIGCKQHVKKFEEPQTSKTMYIEPISDGPTRSKASLNEQATSGSCLKAGKKTEKKSQQPRPMSASIISSNACIKSDNTFQLKPIISIFNRHKSHTARSHSAEVAFSLSVQNVTSYDEQQQLDNATRPSAASINLFYNFLQKFHSKLQESTNLPTSNKLIEVHYYENEMTSAYDRNAKTSPRENGQRRNTISIHKPIAYRCPKRQPKFNAKFIDIRNYVGDKESTTLNTSLSKKPNNSLCSNEQNINRNISPVSKKNFKWPSDIELELDLASVSPSNVSSTETVTCTSSSALSKLQIMHAIELTPYEMPASPHDHELYLAAIEQLKCAIKASRKQRRALEKQSNSSTLEELSEKIDIKTNENLEISAYSKKNNETKSKQHSKLTNEKTTRKTQGSIVSESESQLSAQRSSSTQHLQEKTILTNRFKRFIEGSESVKMLLDTPRFAQQSSMNMNDLELSQRKVEFSKSDQGNIVPRALNLVSSLTTSCEKLPCAFNPSEPEKPYGKQQIRSRNFDSLQISPHDRAQLVRIDNLKQRLKRSIRDIKNQSIQVLGTDKKKDNSRLTHHHNHGHVHDLAKVNASKIKPRRSNKETTRNIKLSTSENTVKISKRNDLKRAKNTEQKTKSRKLAPISTADQTKDHIKKQASQRIKEPNKQKTIAANDKQFKKSDNPKKLIDLNDLKQSKARTSLQRKDLGKENRLPSETNNLKHEKTNDFPIPTKLSITPAEPVNAEMPAEPKCINSTSTKATQCDSFATITDSENFSTEEMDLQTLMNPHTTRSEALSAVLKFRYKSLIERAKGEFAWLQLKKERYKSKGLHEHISAVRKKQQQILKKMESERTIIQQLLESALSSSYLQADPRSQPQQEASLSPIQLTSDNAAEANEPKLSISQRLQRVEYMLAWNFKLDEKEADVAELEHMLLQCNNNVDISVTTSAKSLLYRISKVESRLARINEKLEALENSAPGANAQFINKNTGPRAQQNVGSKLSQFWQRMTSQSYEKSLPKQRIKKETELKNSSNDATLVASNDFEETNNPNESSSSKQYKRTEDDGILVLYSPGMPSLNLNISSYQSEFNEETLSMRSVVTNPTFSLSQRYAKTSDY